MSAILKIRVISLDLFGTLVDVRRSLADVWAGFFGDRRPEQSDWDSATAIVLLNLANAAQAGRPFTSVRSVFQVSFADYFREAHLDYSPKLAAEQWIQGHRASSFYPDAESFLSAVGSKYSLLLACDADKEMIPPQALTIFPPSAVFCSEKLGFYKSSPDYWQRIIEYSGQEPASILHIGDATAEIVGARQSGLRTCWLNRHDRQWDGPVKPDFEAKSLEEVCRILGTA